MTKPEFKQLFLNLTEWTIPFGKEPVLEKYLPSGFKKDSVGNYYYEIGNSETLFTTHLDTYCKKMEKVVHLQDETDEYIIGTDEKTILGGDNKLGCCILIGMIQNKIPGTYYFFLGEEPILSGGLWGSSNALKKNPEFFQKFKRCIAFDRRGYGSVVIRQMGRMSSSEEFIAALSTELKKFGNIEFDEKSKFGYYTDTAAFMDVIPECTNISAGGFNEHYFTEWVDLNYTYNVYQTALKIKWDELPVKREFQGPMFVNEPTKSRIKRFFNFRTSGLKDQFKEKMDQFDLVLTREITKNDITHLTYSAWLEDFDLNIWIKNSRIYFDSSMKKSFTLDEAIKKLQSLYEAS